MAAMDDLFGSDSESGPGSDVASPARSGTASEGEGDEGVVPSRGRKYSASSASEDEEQADETEKADGVAAPAQRNSEQSDSGSDHGGGDGPSSASEANSEAEQDDQEGSSDASHHESAKDAVEQRGEIDGSDGADSTHDAPAAANLFGDADDISDVEGEQHSPDNDEEKEEVVQQEEPVEEELPETKIDVEIPRVMADLGKNVHFVKLPNFLSVDTRPFDPATYEDEIDEEDVLDEEGHARMKLKVENTIRWRHTKSESGEDVLDENGERVRQSNARIVRWSDGSMSLHLGDEIFDVHVMPMQDHNHLFVRQGTGLHGQSIFSTKLTFRPYSTDSFTHRKMTMSLADRSTKLQKIKVLPVIGVDPEAEKAKKLKEAEENLRATIRRENQQRRVRERAHSHPVSARFLEGGYDEDEDGEDAAGVSLAAIKKKYKDKARGKQRGNSSDEGDDSDAEDMRKKRLQKAKKLDVSDDENDNDSDGNASEVGSDVGPPSKKKIRSNDSEDD